MKRFICFMGVILFFFNQLRAQGDTSNRHRGYVKAYFGADNSAMALNQMLKDYGMDHQFGWGMQVAFGVSSIDFRRARRFGIDEFISFGKANFKASNKAYTLSNFGVNLMLKKNLLHHERHAIMVAVGLNAKWLHLNIDTINYAKSFNSLNTYINSQGDKGILAIPVALEYIHRSGKIGSNDVGYHGIRFQYEYGVYQGDWSARDIVLQQQIKIKNPGALWIAFVLGF